jgi:hypothetical protein
LTVDELEEKKNDRVFSGFVMWQVNRYWFPGEKGWLRSFRALGKTKMATTDDCWLKIAGLDAGKPDMYYIRCLQNMLTSQIRKGASIIRKREIAAAKAFIKSNKEYVTVRTVRGRRKRRLVSSGPMDAKYMMLGKNEHSYFRGTTDVDAAQTYAVKNIIGQDGWHFEGKNSTGEEDWNDD